MQRPVIHIIGAGLSGLSAAVALSQSPFDIVVHEASRQAGGRCRSYFDESMGMTIDNGNHLLLSGNKSTLAYVDAIGARHELRGPKRCEIAFADMASGERWTLRPNEGRLPWWLLVESRRVPRTRAADYLSVARLLRGPGQARVGDVMECSGPLYERLWGPFFLAALNTDPRGASAALAAAILRETLARGGRACHPLVAANGLSRAFVDPALKLLRRGGAQVRFERRLRALSFAEDRVAALEFEHDSIALGGQDMMVLATPAHIAATLVPGLSAPQTFNAILNAHFNIAPPANTPPILGVVNAKVQWLFAYPDHLSVTVSDANSLMETPREQLAADLWREVAGLTGLSDDLPSWRIIKERRATFAASPEEDARRPVRETKWPNLLLAGDYVQTGLPATIEGAVRSGQAAARSAMEWFGAV
ncbi:hydroxysqualene dehydroxylase HpnE [Methylocapsa sp. S129]|uniref:hydroxysqualene dehydroxylase HpnE n=1 Tax=Methylocapsa sp. S129 TaxID=1641869 RepID=UPI00131AF9E7|nr:hydroxysqualene dehydroxylase HpnE [Methylocapsa sp. S129]